MGTKTAIEWTDSTWSPIRVRVKADAAAIAQAKGYASLVQIAEKMAGRVGQHCEHVSPECDNCYAGGNNARCLPYNGTGLPYDRRSRDLVDAFVDEKALLQPLKWNPVLTGIQSGEGQLKQVAHKDGSVTVTRERSRRIFVENQSDLFAEWVTDEMLDRVFAVMALCPQHVFQVLTKRPERMLAYLRMVKGEKDMQRWIKAAYAADPNLAPSMAGEMEYLQFPLSNVWLGVSDGGNWHQRIDILRQVPAALRFISAEPLIVNPGTVNLPGIDWVICGGESGPKARPMHPEWARSLRDQCQAAGVPFFFKQWGEWAPYPCRHSSRKVWLCACGASGRITQANESIADHWRICSQKTQAMLQTGKHAAGALLDGVEWKQFPEARA